MFEHATQLRIKAHGDDVKRFVIGQISKLAQCVARDEELKQLVISTIHDAVVVDGM